MIYGVILAGGVGSRMGNREKPKQYINIGDKPIIVHTIEKFCLCSEFEEILILCPKDWIEYSKGLVKKYVSETEKIRVIEGGETRNETIMNAIADLHPRRGPPIRDVQDNRGKHPSGAEVRRLRYGDSGNGHYSREQRRQRHFRHPQQGSALPGTDASELQRGEAAGFI